MTVSRRDALVSFAGLIAAGALPMNRGTLAAWIADPQAIKPGARMPAATVSAEQVRDIADWLESLK